MPETERTRVQPLRPVVMRTCTECLEAPLLLISALPSANGPGSMARMYQCSKCQHIEKVVTDSKWEGWLRSADLRPPS